MGFVEHGPAAHDGAFDLPHLTNRIEGHRRAQRHFEHAKPPGDERFRDQASLARVVEDQNRNDRRQAHDVADRALAAHLRTSPASKGSNS